MSLAQMNGIDLATEVDRKIAKNAARIYERDARDVARRVAEAGSATVARTGRQGAPS